MWKKIFGISENSKAKGASKSANPLDGIRILKHAQAMRVVFFYPGEEGTYVDDCMVTLFENGVVHLRAKSEETTTHLHHCEILWRYEAQPDSRKDDSNQKLRVVKFKGRDGGKRENPKDSEKKKEDSRDPEPPTSH